MVTSRLAWVGATGFWQQPDAAPEPAPEKQPPQPVNAVWDKLLGDTVIVAAITDRLLHHGYVVSIRGESRRQIGGPATTARTSDLAGPRPEEPARSYCVRHWSLRASLGP